MTIGLDITLFRIPMVRPEVADFSVVSCGLSLDHNRGLTITSAPTVETTAYLLKRTVA